MLRRITAPYAWVEAFAYDRVIAPALKPFQEAAFSGWVEALPLSASVLDVGCGGGQLLAALAQRRPDLKLSGIDLAPSQVRRARRRIAATAHDAEVLHGSAAALPFSDGRFDLVTSVASIKHWSDPARGVFECVRVARPGGRVVVVEADRGCRYEDALRFVATWTPPGPPRLVSLAFFRTFIAGRSPDVDEARVLGEKSGLADLEARRLPGLPAWVLTGRRASD